MALQSLIITVAPLEQVSRGLLPDTGSEYEGDGGNINDALEFLLLNFTEMNKLWVRMQHQGSGKDRCGSLLFVQHFTSPPPILVHLQLACCKFMTV
jgi:hypothetical protein